MMQTISAIHIAKLHLLLGTQNKGFILALIRQILSAQRDMSKAPGTRANRMVRVKSFTVEPVDITQHKVKESLISIHLRTDLKVLSNAGVDITPKGRKPQALLALLSLTDGGRISRQRVASLLWSNCEPTISLARLRDVIHNLKSSISHVGSNVLELSNGGLALLPNLVEVKLGNPNRSLDSETDFWAHFLTDLDGIDDAFDRWLAAFRLEHQRGGALVRLSDRPITKQRTNYDRVGVALTAIATAATDELCRLARVLVGELSSVLARIRWFHTVTRNTRGHYLKVGDEDLSDLAEYALFGTLETREDGYYFFIELMALGPKRQVEWAQRYEMTSSVGSDEIETLAQRIAARVDTELLLAEVARQSFNSPSTNVSAYSMVLRAVPAIYQLERESFLGSGHLLGRAVELSPDSAFAQSWLAYWYIFLVGQGWATNPAQAMTKAGRAAEQAMVLDPKDARGFTIAGHVRAFLGRRLNDAEALHRIALELNPALSLAWHLAGMTSAYSGRLDEGYSRLCRSKSVNGDDPMAFYVEAGLTVVHLLRHEHGQAALIGQRVTQRHPNFTSAYKSTIAALGHLGDKSEAHRLLDRLRTLEPHFSLRRFQVTAPYQRREDLGHFVEGLRLAGVT